MNEIETYRAALKEARADFQVSTERMEKAQQEATAMRNKLVRLRRTITALAAMCSEVPWADPLGITDSCLEVMENTPYRMTTNDVVKGLEELGFELASQKNAAASVHSVLSRLAEKGKIEKDEAGDKKAVLWTGPKYDPKIYEGITDDDIPF
jgi:hypothetical protein